MKTLSTILLNIALCLLPILQAEAVETGSADVRRSLIEEERIEYVYPIDGYHTLVIGDLRRAGRMAGAEKTEPLGNALLIKHAEEQPFIYKSPKLGADNEVSMQTGEAIRLGESERPMDMYLKAQALCVKAGGALSFVIPKSYGSFKRLTEADPIEAALYILTSGRKDTAWFISCAGEVRFLVEKNYISISNGEDVAYFRAGRGLEGVDYLKGKEEVSAAALKYETPNTPVDLEKFRSQMAWEVSSLKMEFVKPHNGVRYTGHYNGTSISGCDHVSIMEPEDNEEGDLSARVYDFKVCDDRVASLGEREIKGQEAVAFNMYANR